MTLGITLLIIGTCSFVAGVVLIKNEKAVNPLNSSKISEPVELKSPEDIARTFANKPVEKGNKAVTKAETLDSLIHVAVADGQLTNNEQKLLQAKASELGLDYADYKPKIEELLAAKQQSKETNIINPEKEKGDNFEKFVVQKFSQKYFTILEWAGDKFVNGKYAETTTQPDLKIRFKYNEVSEDFSVECKYRSDYYNDGIEWCTPRQLQNYKRFSADKNIPVFIAIGVSGESTEPNELYIIPLNKIESNFLTKDFLLKYKKANFKDHNFYYDSKSNTLK
jgi:hypothetical protein